jgi:O-antigen/teichoic acid export membrane protein
MAINLVVQVMVVRYLSRSDYGGFAYALSVASMMSTLAVFGLDKSLPRFLPIYEERRDYKRLTAALALSVATVLLIGGGTVLAIGAAAPMLSKSFTDNETIRLLLLIMVCLAPLQALDCLLVALFGVFANPRAIFFRRHLLGPGLQLIVVGLLILCRGSVAWVAAGYVAATLAGLVVCIALLTQLLRERKVTRRISLSDLKMPAGEIFGFTAPLLASDLVFVLRTSLVVVLIGQYCGTAEVAGFRSALPVARLNLLVLQSFTLMFTPLAARMFARGDREGIDHLYWRSAVWIALASFPVLAATYSLSGTVTRVLYGNRYADSSAVLALLAIGHYFNAALGFNGLTLRVLGKVRYLVVTDLLTALANIGISVLVIPRYGAAGAAAVTCVTMVVQNVAYQAGLAGTGVSVFRKQALPAYGSIAAAAIGLWSLQFLFRPPVLVSVFLAALTSFLVLSYNRRTLELETTFPEILRIPAVRWAYSRAGRTV